MEQEFLVSIILDDLPEEFKDDLEGHIREAVGSKFGFDADISFAVQEIK